MRVVVRGGGDLASGTVYKLFQCGFEVVILECEKPTSIRRYVSFSEAVYHGSSKVEGVICKKANSLDEAETILKENKVALLIDPTGKYIANLHPDVVIDAILAKKNLGTKIDMANIVIALGPGFEAKKDAHAIIETKISTVLPIVFKTNKDTNVLTKSSRKDDKMYTVIMAGITILPLLIGINILVIFTHGSPRRKQREVIPPPIGLLPRLPIIIKAT